MSDRRCLLGSLLSGTILGSAALFPDTYSAVILAAFAIFGICLSGRASDQPARHLFAAGVMFTTTAFYWIPHPIQLFGGFPPALAYLCFGLFVLTSALQFGLVGWLYGKLRTQHAIDETWVLLPFLWFASELLFPRVFPWGVANNFLRWRSFSSLAGIVGVYPLSFLLFAWAAHIIDLVFVGRAERGISHLRLLSVCAAIALPLSAGAYRHNLVSDSIRVAPRAKIGLIQGNLHAKQGADVMMLVANLETYRALSHQVQQSEVDLVLWPESVMNVWMPTTVKSQSLRRTKYDPYPDGAGRLLYGTMTFEKKPDDEISRLRDAGALQSEEDTYDKYNSAVAIDDGGVLGMYHKRALMPFGEFLPFASAFPSLRKLSPYTGDLTPGRIVSPILFPENKEKKLPELRVGVLICYEDLVPALSREYALLDANVLVNLTNDAWFGFSHSQRQHRMLASWRAIESGRTLVRDTNTGDSAVVDPAGETLAAIPLYSEGYAIADVPLLGGKTIYVRIGDTVAWLILIVGTVFFFVQYRRRPAPEPGEASNAG